MKVLHVSGWMRENSIFVQKLSSNSVNVCSFWNKPDPDSWPWVPVSWRHKPMIQTSRCMSEHQMDNLSYQPEKGRKFQEWEFYLVLLLNQCSLLKFFLFHLELKKIDCPKLIHGSYFSCSQKDVELHGRMTRSLRPEPTQLPRCVAALSTPCVLQLHFHRRWNRIKAKPWSRWHSKWDWPMDVVVSTSQRFWSNPDVSAWPCCALMLPGKCKQNWEMDL